MSNRFGSITINSDKASPPPERQDKTVRRQTIRPPQKNRGKTVGFLLIAVLLISSYFWAGLYLAPLLIKKYLPRHILNSTGLELVIDHVQLNPLNFQLTLDGIRADLPGSGTEKPLLQGRSLFVDLHLTSLLRNDFVCDKLTIRELELNLIRHKDKTYNFPPLPPFSRGQGQGEIINFATLPFLFSLNNIDISDGRIYFKDLLTETSHSVEDLQLGIPTLSNFSFQSNNYIQPHFSAVINGSEVQLSGEAVRLAGEEGFQTKLSCSINSLDLVPYFSYLPVTFPFTLTRGRADTSIDIGFSPKRKEGSRLSLDIKMSATDIGMEGKNNDLKITIPSLETVATLSPTSKRLHFKSLQTKGSHLTGSRKAVADSLQHLLSYSQNRYTDTAIISIDRMLAENGRAILYPHPEKGEKPSEWTALQLSIHEFHPKNSTGSLHFRGKQGGNGGDFSWQAGFSQSGTIQGKLLLNGFPATTFFALLSPPPGIKVKGKSTFSGDLAFPHSQDSTPAYTVDNGILQLHNLELIRGKTSWLTAESVRLSQLSRTGEHSRLGKISLKQATLKLNSRKMSPLFSKMLQQKTRPRIEDIDFSGTLLLESGTDPQKSLQLDNVHWQLKGLNQAPEAENFSFTGHLGSDGLIKAEGTLNLIPPTLQASVNISNVDSSRLGLFFPDWPLLRDNQTTLHGEGIYRFPESSFQGEIQLTAASLLQDSRKNPLLSWKLATFSGLRYQFSPPFLRADQLLLDTPRLKWRRSTIPPMQELQQGLRKLFILDSEEEQFFPLAIKKISFRNGSVNILDQRLSPPWKTTAEALTGRINNFNTTNDGLSSFTMNGVTEDAPLSLSGSGALFRPTLEARARLKLTDFPLAAFAKQLASTPVTADEATLHLQMDLARTNSKESGKAELTINNLDPAPGNADTALALALLKDREGSFPLTVETNEGHRSLFQKSLNSFQTRVIKASHAPFLLDSRFSDLQDRNFTAFHPGTSTISAAGKETLIRYAELLAEHPSLALSVRGMADGKMDRQVLKKELESREQQRVNEENRIREQEFNEKKAHPPPEQAGSTTGKGKFATEDLQEYSPLLPDPVHVSDEELLDLARERAFTVYDFCVHSLGMIADRIGLAEEGKVPAASPANGVRLRITPLPADVE